MPALGPSRLFTVTVRATRRLSDLLTHLYVLVPVLDDQKHYWVGDDEVEKLLRHGEGWLDSHPSRDAIVSRYLVHQRGLVRDAIARLTAEEQPEEEAAAAQKDEQEASIERTISLNERRLDAIRFQGPGTDLTVGLLPASKWNAAEFETVDGHKFVPNIPTEEVFTTPDPARTEGTVRATRPFSPAGGVVVEGLELRFENGRVVDVRADRGEDVVRAQLASDDGAARLGEVALVDGNSRVGQLGVVFFDVMFDENAACHIAYGKGLPMGVDGEM